DTHRISLNEVQHRHLSLARSVLSSLSARNRHHRFFTFTGDSMNCRLYRAVSVAIFAFSTFNSLPAAAAVAIDVNTSADRTTASTSVASPSFSTTMANELLLAFVPTDAAGGTTAAVTSV